MRMAESTGLRDQVILGLRKCGAKSLLWDENRNMPPCFRTRAISCKQRKRSSCDKASTTLLLPRTNSNSPSWNDDRSRASHRNAGTWGIVSCIWSIMTGEESIATYLLAIGY